MRATSTVAAGAHDPGRRLYRGWLVGILLLTIGAYANTFRVDFVFDDLSNLVDNPLIRDLRPYFDRSVAESSATEPGQLYSLRSRWVGFLSFALNYRVHGLEVTGYHVVNLLIHLLSGVLLWRLVDRTLALPSLRASGLAPHRRPVALFSAALFLVHPIQTQAVTYIVQRVTSLAAMFCLLALVLYVEARLAGRWLPRIGLYGASLAALVAAMFSKENAASFPLVILLYELLFLSGSMWRRLVGMLPHLVTMAIVPSRLLLERGLPAVSVETVATLERSDGGVSPFVYLATQLRVVVTYLRLLSWPANQNLDYDYPLRQSLREPSVLASLSLLAGLVALALWMIWRGRRGDRAWSWIGFGVLWFFLALSVESSVVPIADVLVEHRLYLPSAGWIVAVVGLAAWHWPRTWHRAGAAIGVAAVLLLAAATYRRNSVWQSPLRLWSDTAEKSPDKSRPLNSLGSALELQGERERALGYYRRAVARDPRNYEAAVNLGRMLLLTGDSRGSAQVLLDALALAPSSTIARALFLDAARLARGSERSVAPGDTSAYRQALAGAAELRATGRHREAIAAYERLLAAAPGDSNVWNGLGSLYLDRGMAEFALISFTTAARIAPDDGASFANLGLALKRLGRLEEAEAALRRAVALDPSQVPALNNLGNLMLARGRLEEARDLFRSALELDADNPIVQRNLDLASTALQGPEVDPPQ